MERVRVFEIIEIWDGSSGCTPLVGGITIHVCVFLFEWSMCS